MFDANDLRILYEDGPCLVVLKPSGVATQAPPGIDSMEVRIREYLHHREGRDPKDVYLGVPHRLHRPVSGVMIFCTKYRATRKLAEQFEGRLVNKTYWACLAGHVMPEAGTWEDYLRKIPGEACVEVVAARNPEGRLAVLHYQTREKTDWGSLLEIRLETGRTHQIRVQAASRGHPILGDEQYGSTIPFGMQFDDRRRRAIALHARTLEFRHPTTKEMTLVTAPITSEWQQLIPDLD
jgi:23S rRNA pseudouridine1911/1915/1917 synthase